ncbi:uncharacterized protein LOC144297911 isoform X5 [Canis aureus]
MLKERTYRTSCKSTYRILDITSLLLLILKHSWVVDIVTQVHTEALTEKTLCKELILFFEGIRRREALQGRRNEQLEIIYASQGLLYHSL